MPQKRLGQHFLTNTGKLREIAEALDLNSDNTIIEIGPGHGELTRLIAENFQFSIFPPKADSAPEAHSPRARPLANNFQIIAIEKDARLAQCLKKIFKNDRNIEIIEGDALKILPKIIGNRQSAINDYKITGNIPYYITGYLLRVIDELENKPSLIVLTTQKEVAERICAGPPRMNLLAASVQFWAEPKIISYISKKDFQPQPKVESAIIRLSPKFRVLNSQTYYRLIKILFKQPRKTILNNLTSAANGQTPDGRQRSPVGDQKTKESIAKLLKILEISPNDRPQNLAIEQIKKLSEFF